MISNTHCDSSILRVTRLWSGDDTFFLPILWNRSGRDLPYTMDFFIFTMIDGEEEVL
jgi:hypothetical protein